MLTVNKQIIDTKNMTPDELMRVFQELERKGLLGEDSTAFETEDEVNMARRLGRL